VDKPICGAQGDATDDVLTVILAIWGIVGTIGSVVGILSDAAKAGVLTILGVSAPGLAWLAAAAAALATVITIFAFYWNRCLDKPDGLQACSAGVVNEIVPSFDSAADELFPFTAMHDRVDVVVKSQYWPLVQQLALFVKCAGDPDRSPIIQGLYESDDVCAAGLGATIGGVAGAVGGILLGALVAGAIGCAGSGIFYVLCLIVVMLIAAIIAAVVALVGAFIGGQIGKAAAGDTEPTADSGNVIQVGDYVTTKGNLITSGDFDGARIYWFVEATTVHGRSTGSPQFSFRDPDTNLALDACPPRVVGAPAPPR
jgi:hypothetical protein